MGLPTASPGKAPTCKPLSWFLAAVSRLRPLLLKLYGQIPLHSISPSSFRSSSLSTHHWRQSKKYACHKSVAYSFLLPCGGGTTCWRLPSLGHRKLRIVLLAQNPHKYKYATQDKPRYATLSYFQYLQRSSGKRMAQAVAQK